MAARGHRRFRAWIDAKSMGGPGGTPVAGVWVFAWHGLSGGGRIDVWVYPSEHDAWRAAAEAAVENGDDWQVLADAGQDAWRSAVEAWNETATAGTRLEVTFAPLQLAGAFVAPEEV